MDPVKAFSKERRENIDRLGKNKKLKKWGRDFTVETIAARYSFNFDWLGRPIIQHPQDIVALQELIWKIKPDLVIETGIAHGGSLILSASILELLGGRRKVVGIDIEIYKHNRTAIEEHPLAKRIIMLEGSSTDPVIVEKVRRLARGKKVLAYLDSSHNHDHVLRELELYAPLVSKGSYIVVFDTIAEYVPARLMAHRPWGHGNNPKTAVDAFLREHKNFVVDRDIENKLLITAAPGGYLKRVR